MNIIIKTLLLLIFPVVVYSQEKPGEDWLEDLKAYHQGLEQNHIDLYNKINEQDFKTELSKIEKSISKKNDLGIILDLMRLIRKIGDGHTAISLRNRAFHYFPFEVQNFNGDWRVIKVDKKFSELLGLKLTAIESENIESVVEKVGDVAQFVENEQSLIVRTGEYLRIGELLHGLNITNDQLHSHFGFVSDDGEKTNIQLTAISQQQYDETRFAEIEIGVSQIIKPENPTYNFLWYALIEGTNGLYIQFREYPQFDQMMKLGEELLAYLLKHNVQSLVIDMRKNGGGDLYTGLVMAYALNLADPVNWKSGVYILVDKVTFSAATSNAALFRELLNAKIIGEPTGSNPTGYQDMDTFELPNSKLLICYSKRLFRIQDTATSGVRPDVPLHYDWNCYSQGKDNMLEWVINKIKEQ